jgi:hypothetical protein
LLRGLVLDKPTPDSWFLITAILLEESGSAGSELPKGKRVIEDFVVQWRKMKEALERQEERLKEEFVDEPLNTDYQSRIGQLITVLEELLTLHGTRT